MKSLNEGETLVLTFHLDPGG
jgi:translation initiation factor IF-3